MAATSGGASPAVNGPRSVAETLFAEGYRFDFFQAVRLLDRLARSRAEREGTDPPAAVGYNGPHEEEAVRFRSLASMAFPASAVYDVAPPSSKSPVPLMTVTFLGLTGPSGALPDHVTEELILHERFVRGPEKEGYREWLDLFNHRLISLFYRAWEKYRFYVPYERGLGTDPGAFGDVLASLIGLGLDGLRNRLQVTVSIPGGGGPKERVLGRIDDQALMHYAGFLTQWPRCAVILETLLCDYFELPIEVRQFQPQWLSLDEASQSRPTAGPATGPGWNNRLGRDTVAGARYRDIRGKFRLRIGPLDYKQFVELLPDRSPLPPSKTFFLLTHLTRLYIGIGLDFDVQLVLRARDVPRCQLSRDTSFRPRLGWNTWVLAHQAIRDGDDPVFRGIVLRQVNSPDTTRD